MNYSTKSTVQGRLWLTKAEHNFIGRDRIELLEKIAEHGSIAKAAKAMKIGYKTAWDAVDSMNNLSHTSLVKRTIGGKGGGGTQLTMYAYQLIATFKAIEQEHQVFLQHLTQKMEAFEDFFSTMRSLSVQTSARNEFLGEITQIKAGPVNAEVVLRLKGETYLVAVVTHEAISQLGLEEGKQAYALIKAPQVMVVRPNSHLKFSARNQLCGKVSQLTPGAVNAEVSIALEGGNTLKAIITQEAAKDLALAEGEAICGIFKAMQVILAIGEAE